MPINPYEDPSVHRTTPETGRISNEVSRLILAFDKADKAAPRTVNLQNSLGVVAAARAGNLASRAFFQTKLQRSVAPDVIDRFDSASVWYIDLFEAALKNPTNATPVRSISTSAYDKGQVTQLKALMLGSTDKPESSMLADGDKTEVVEMVANIIDTYAIRMQHRTPRVGNERKTEIDTDESGNMRMLVGAMREPVAGLAHEVGHSAIQTYVDALQNLGMVGEVGELLDICTTKEGATQVAIATMNSFGVVPTVKMLQQKISSASGRTKEMLSGAYENVQGKTVTEVMENLSQIYNEFNYEAYKLNNDELKRQEVAIVKKHAPIDPKQRLSIVDIGAGNGRVSLELKGKLGENASVISMDIEKKHTEQIKECEPDASVMRVDWHHLPLQGGSVDIALSFGRSILHNNNPQDMLLFFDEMHRVLRDGGSFIFDLPDIDKQNSDTDNVYTNEVNRYREHLQSLGAMEGVSNRIFDGPDGSHLYNRMTLSQQQLEMYALLFGFNLKKVDSRIVGEEDGAFENSYYEMQKVADYDISTVEIFQLKEAIQTLGLLEPGVDMSLKPKAWGFRVGSVFLSDSTSQLLDTAPLVKRVIQLTGRDGRKRLEQAVQIR